MTPTQLESIRAARLQLLDHGDEAAAKALEWAVTAEPDEEVLPRLDIRQAFEREFSECDLSRTAFGDYASTRVQCCWIGWKRHAAFAMAEDRADRNHALAYLRQAEQLLTGNEATLYAENQRLRAQLNKDS